MGRRPTDRPQRPNAVVRKIQAANRFYDGLAALSPRLSPAAVAAWGWLWRCERGRLARASVARLADRLGVSPRTARRALKELRDRGFVACIRRGYPRRVSVYRMRPTPWPPPGPAAR